MNKLRSDSAFCQLTPQQCDTLEEWLFEERFSYPKVVEKLKAEFGLETSLTGVRRFYKRLDWERLRQSLVDVVETSGWAVEALKGGNLKPGMLLLANKCAFELMMKSDPPVRKVTALLRAITSAEARAFRQTVDDREQAELRERERVRKVEEERSRVHWRIKWEDEEERRQKRAARKKAKLAAEKNAGVAKLNGEKEVKEATSPRPSPPEAERGKDRADLGSCPKLEQRNCECSLPPHPGPLPLGEGDLAAAVVVADGASGVVETIEKDASGEWQPSVVEEPEYEENSAAEAAENRLTPLNAA